MWETGMFEMQNRGAGNFRENGVLTSCLHTPLALSVSPTLQDIPFSSRDGDRIGVRLLLVAQDLAKGAVLGQSTATVAMAVRSKREECRR